MGRYPVPTSISGYPNTFKPSPSVNAKTSSARHISVAALKALQLRKSMERCFSLDVPGFGRHGHKQMPPSATGGKGDRGQGSRRAERNQSADGAVGGKSGKEET